MIPLGLPDDSLHLVAAYPSALRTHVYSTSRLKGKAYLHNPSGSPRGQSEVIDTGGPHLVPSEWRR